MTKLAPPCPRCGANWTCADWCYAEQFAAAERRDAELKDFASQHTFHALLLGAGVRGNGWAFGSGPSFVEFQHPPEEFDPVSLSLWQLQQRKVKVWR